MVHWFDNRELAHCVAEGRSSSRKTKLLSRKLPACLLPNLRMWLGKSQASIVTWGFFLNIKSVDENVKNGLWSESWTAFVLMRVGCVRGRGVEVAKLNGVARAACRWLAAALLLLPRMWEVRVLLLSHYGCCLLPTTSLSERNFSAYKPL